MKKSVISLLILCMVLAFFPGTHAEAEPVLAVLYTNDVHCAIDPGYPEGTMGYAHLAALKKELSASYPYVALVDAGDAIQGEAIGTLSDGQYLVQIMDHLGYDYAVFGNHEFDYGMDVALSLRDRSGARYLACNFTDLRTGAPVTDGYHVETYGDLKVGYVGICTPETFTKSSPAHFQDGDGNFIYSFAQKDDGQELYDAVQKSVDAARAEGADVIVAIGHLGTDESSAPWRSTDVIAATGGIDVFIDGHSHTVIPGQTVADKNGDPVILSSTGNYLQNIGLLTIDADGNVSTELIADYPTVDPETDAFIKDIQSLSSEKLEEVVGYSHTQLIVWDPTTGERLIRHRETNLGDWVADAYRAVCGAQIAVVNGGGIRAPIDEGPVTLGQLLSIHPYGNMLCMVRTTGQEILDLLEVSSMESPHENGSFLQVSGLRYTIDTTVPSTVVLDEFGMVSALGDSRRVKDVQVLLDDGSWAPLDPSATYTLASHDYLLKEGGCAVDYFKDDVYLIDSMLLDNQALIRYIRDHLGGVIEDGYTDPYGQGRITILDAPEQTLPEASAPSEDIPQTGDTVAVLPLLPVCLSVLALIFEKRRYRS